MHASGVPADVLVFGTSKIIELIPLNVVFDTFLKKTLKDIRNVEFFPCVLSFIL